jgi:hypothetical protein
VAVQRRITSVNRETERITNELVFRSVNERMKEIDDRLDTSVVGAPVGEREEFVCECGQLDCMARFEMTRDQYESVRAHGARFVVLPGHEDPEIEQVVETHAQFLVVEKLPGGPAEAARESDPRV